jgi:hypothetical protein
LLLLEGHFEVGGSDADLSVESGVFPGDATPDLPAVAGEAGHEEAECDDGGKECGARLEGKRDEFEGVEGRVGPDVSGLVHAADFEPMLSGTEAGKVEAVRRPEAKTAPVTVVETPGELDVPALGFGPIELCDLWSDLQRGADDGSRAGIESLDAGWGTIGTVAEGAVVAVHPDFAIRQTGDAPGDDGFGKPDPGNVGILSADEVDVARGDDGKWRFR